MGKFAEYLEKCEGYSYVTANLAACILIPKRNVTSFYIYSVTANLAACILVPKRNVTLFYIYSVNKYSLLPNIGHYTFTYFTWVNLLSILKSVKDTHM